MKLKHFIPKSKEKTYYTLPFEVPDNVERITVRYDYKRPVRGALQAARTKRSSWENTELPRDTCNAKRKRVPGA